MADPAEVEVAVGDQGLQEPLLDDQQPPSPPPPPRMNQQGLQEPPPPPPRMNQQAFIGFLSKVADAAVMGLLTLNIFSATFLLAWGHDGSVCLPKAKADKDESKKLPDDDHFTVPSWVKVAIIGLPFAIYPLTVYVSGLVKAVEQGGHGLGVVATLCLVEFVYGLLIGGLMTVCMSEAPWPWVLGVTICLNVVLLVIWGCHFEQPARLRYIMSGACAWFRRFRT